MKNSPPVTITILAYRSKATISECLRSILALIYEGPLEVRIREQGGDDEEYALLKGAVAQASMSPGRTFVLTRGENLGFAGGHNALIRDSSAEFVVCVNADAVLEPDFLEAALEPFSDPQVGAVQGKLVRYDFSTNTPRKDQEGRRIIDTTGLLMYKNRRIVNRGQGEGDSGQFDRQEEIFGADGAVPVYRRAALDDVMVPFAAFRNANEARRRSRALAGAQPVDQIKDLGQVGEFFDEDFFLYKEDVDLAWRLRLAGWRTIYMPRAVAYHERGSGDSAATSPLAILKERRKINSRAKFLSFRNQRLMQVKDELPGLLVRHLPWFLCKELAAWAYVILFEGMVAPRAVRECFLLLSKMLKKRRYIMSRLRISAAALSRWFV